MAAASGRAGQRPRCTLSEFLVAGLSSIVGFKRLADRPRDRNDLIGLAEIHGELPVESIPGLDTDT